ncbi:hypothetical protein [Haloarcula sediminis]|uniref:hypothetical protein n=1 Tax=Haloarcula sediminis TaxID=3111777 RepID=UPI002D77FDAA|nr:hypothetical protein [Haloarcula sp. CK38]
MTTIEVGEVVTLTELDSDPPLLVLTVDERSPSRCSQISLTRPFSGSRPLSVTVRDGKIS